MHPVDGDKVIYSKIIPCSHKGCLRDAVRAYQRGEPFAKEHGLTSIEQTFGTFKPVKGTETALKFAREFAHGGDFVWLLIYGGTGNGKTHLCNAIAKDSLERGHDVKMITAADMFAEMRLGIEHKNAETVIKKFKDIFVLIVDDWGVEYGTEWEKAKFDEVMTSRYSTVRPTVVTTNQDITELSQRLRSRFDDKFMSRMAHNSGLDFRKEKGG